jgi:hypothetical protein
VSIKRSKQRSFGSKDSGEDEGIFAKKKVVEKTWEELTTDVADSQFKAYAPSTRFENGALLNHSKFGKGAVVAVEANKIDVLFQDGPKKLGHGVA